MFSKNQIVTIKIQDLGSEGEGVGRIDQFIVFVDQALPGELVKVRLTEVKKSYAKGTIEQILEPSPLRQQPPCSIYRQCGGCQLQHLSYAGQLQAKQKRVKDALERIGHFTDVQVQPCVPSSEIFSYRNKIQLPVVLSSKGTQIGFYQHRTHEIIDLENCLIHCKLGDQIFHEIKQKLLASKVIPYNETTGTGELRHCLIKTATSSQEVLVTFITNGEASDHFHKFANDVFASSSSIKGVVQNIKSDRSNTILGKEYRTLAGRPYIYETIQGLIFKVSSASFFQVNPAQAASLYEKVISLANIDSNTTIVDAYCGVGTLTLLLAKRGKQVIGIDCVPDAISDAKENAKQNEISNVEFHCLPVENATSLLQKGEVVILNPPRTGCHELVLKALTQQKIVYISCNPATLARDLSILNQSGYQLKEACPFDMFPQTAHVETVVVMVKEHRTAP